mmetsp:Transcript_1733/g.5735  ORF Transcript_1733/g.5735 Transcript_1733/m.5735 type:complete len:427 (+) Transcript_1733:97-1377(+)
MRSSKHRFAPWSALVLLLALLSKRGLVKRGAGLTRASDALCKAPLSFERALNGTATRCAAKPGPKQRRRAVSPLLRRWDAATARTARRRAPLLRAAPGRRASPRAAPHCGRSRVTRPRRATPRHTSAPPRATLALNASTQDVVQLADSHKLGHHPEPSDQGEAARRRRQLGVLRHLPQLVEGRTGVAQGLCQGPLLPQGRRRERGRRRRRGKGNVPVAVRERHQRDPAARLSRLTGEVGADAPRSPGGGARRPDGARLHHRGRVRHPVLGPARVVRCSVVLWRLLALDLDVPGLPRCVEGRRGARLYCGISARGDGPGQRRPADRRRRKGLCGGQSFRDRALRALFWALPPLRESDARRLGESEVFVVADRGRVIGCGGDLRWICLSIPPADKRCGRGLVSCGRCCRFIPLDDAHLRLDEGGAVLV